MPKARGQLGRGSSVAPAQIVYGGYLGHEQRGERLYNLVEELQVVSATTVEQNEPTRDTKAGKDTDLGPVMTS